LTPPHECAEQGIRVNAVCPGVIDSEMVKRFTGGQPEAEAAMIPTEPVGRLGQPRALPITRVTRLGTFGPTLSDHSAVQ